MSWWSQYRGRSCGRIIHAMYIYGGLQIAETITVGSHYVTLHGRIIAHYEWEGEETPHFKFYDVNDHFLKDRARQWRREQFIKKPFLDEREALLCATYIAQEIRNVITYSEALLIRHVWDVLEGDFSNFYGEGTPELKAKIMRVIDKDSHGRLKDRAEELWQHFAFCAVYEDLKHPERRKHEQAVVQ